MSKQAYLKSGVVLPGSTEFVKEKISWPTFGISAGVLSLFVLMALIDLDTLSSFVNQMFAFSARYFGAFWQILVLLIFFISGYVALSRSGRARMGDLPCPNINTFKWFSIILCTLLAGGGVFFAAAEPMAHFLTTPPVHGIGLSEQEAVAAALAQGYMHWGFLGWAIYGSLATITFMHLHYDKGLPLKPRTLLYPVFGDRAINGMLGNVVDAVCCVAIVAGTVAPIGFLGLQISYGLSALFGISNEFTTQWLIVAVLMCMYTVSSVSGIHRGIQLLSTFNVLLALGLIIFILFFGPTQFIASSFVQAHVTYITNFLPMATFRGDTGWVNQWTVFFWGWFLGYGPLMAIFVARISNGRQIREMIFAVAIMAPIVTSFWFTIVGGTGLAFELAEPGIISGPFEDSNMPAALLAITQQLPMGFVISILFLVLTTVFVATTGDSMSYTISIVMTGRGEPAVWLRAFWGIMMGILAITLIKIGSGSISALQSFIVITAVPVSILMLPTLWFGPLFARHMAAEQDLL